MRLRRPPEIISPQLLAGSFSRSSRENLVEVVALYPRSEPHDQGMLDVGDGNLVYWEVRGNPSGKPALIVHGGPGSSLEGSAGRSFDPERFRIVLFDQRGCGRSKPHASGPTTDMSVNTEHLLADMELLRAHLGIDRWLLTRQGVIPELIGGSPATFPHAGATRRMDT